MVASSCSNGDYDWAKQVKQFDETKAGVKGLVDTGITKIPELFVHPRKSLESSIEASLELPTIDLGELRSGRQRVVAEIRKAAQEWGFFRIVNHAIPLETMDAMLAAVKRFHELPNADKAPFYMADTGRRVRFSSNLPTREDAVACWRDFLSCVFHDDQLDPEEIPSACRDQVQEYVKYMIELREVMAELLSEALGLPRDYLSGIQCMKSQALACLYYPKCPEPNRTLGSS
ncbi:hypothetical protein AAHA92_24127 [Salvia divinorum]|uniref:Non-haem dioxygenase N-terminal domain-containing protein n=1 Tax=Salvia divinorum TaxID=28513 RepID=A0ABD1G6E9_SALDI